MERPSPSAHTDRKEVLCNTHLVGDDLTVNHHESHYSPEAPPHGGYSKHALTPPFSPIGLPPMIPPMAYRRCTKGHIESRTIHLTVAWPRASSRNKTVRTPMAHYTAPAQLRASVVAGFRWSYTTPDNCIIFASSMGTRLVLCLWLYGGEALLTPLCVGMLKRLGATLG